MIKTERVLDILKQSLGVLTQF
jgi:hypothetical protein